MTQKLATPSVVCPNSPQAATVLEASGDVVNGAPRTGDDVASPNPPHNRSHGSAVSTVRIWSTLGFVFATTILVSAFLLFQVQPLISKYILPWFGGSPAVWTTCMLFFQLVLFGGYTYAHLLTRYFSPRMQAIVHLSLLAVAIAVTFPSIAPAAAWKPIDSSHPTGRILALLAVTVGLPYFVLSTTGPLVQAWFAKAWPQSSPYRLYALSN